MGSRDAPNKSPATEFISVVPALCSYGLHPKSTASCRAREPPRQAGWRCVGSVQRAVPVLEGDTPDTLAARVFEVECDAYPEAIRLFAEGRLEIENGKLSIRS